MVSGRSNLISISTFGMIRGLYPREPHSSILKRHRIQSEYGSFARVFSETDPSSHLARGRVAGCGMFVFYSARMMLQSAGTQNIKRDRWSRTALRHDSSLQRVVTSICKLIGGDLCYGWQSNIRCWQRCL